MATRKTAASFALALLIAASSARAEKPSTHTGRLVSGIVLTSTSGALLLGGAGLLVYAVTGHDDYDVGPHFFSFFAALNCGVASLATGIPGAVLLAKSRSNAADPRVAPRQPAWTESRVRGVAPRAPFTIPILLLAHDAFGGDRHLARLVVASPFGRIE
jgi:hypothetical protein